MREEKRQLTYVLVANLNIAKEIHKYDQENIDTLGRNMIHMYIHNNLIPKMLEGMSNGTTNSKLLENYGLTMLCQDTVGE